MANVFWSSAKPDPKRQYRFIVTIGDSQATSANPNRIPQFVAKTVTKPKVSITTVPHMFLDHEFKYPGRVTWDPVTVTMVDPGGEDDIAAALINRLGISGYKYPDTTAQALISLSKEKASNALGSVFISQLNAEGRTVEEWALHNAFITSLDFGGLDYGSDDLSEISLELTYDWAVLNGSGGLGVADAAGGLIVPDQI
mgnify:CR=1 FL=1|tara:strand:- start:12439 stop:13032 length:594 start_codon:yes stop_codon:yes gene_type:complete